MNEPFVTNATDVEQLEFAERKLKDDQRRYHELWRLQLSTYEGREFIWRLLGQLPGTEDIYGDQAFVYRQLGRRSVWLELELEIAKHPELMLQMRNEAVKREQKLRREIAGQRAAERGKKPTT